MIGFRNLADLGGSMKAFFLSTCLVVGVGAFTPVAGAAETSAVLPGVGERVADLEPLDGLMKLHIDRHRGKVFLELPPAEDPEARSRARA